MKKLFIFLGAILLAGNSFAWWETIRMNKSSFTATNETAIWITSTTPSDIFVGVVVSSGGQGTATFYDSKNSATSTIGKIQLGATQGAFFIPFDVVLSSGLTYTTAKNTGNGISIIWKKTNPTVN
jgi:hypothetical protein